MSLDPRSVLRELSAFAAAVMVVVAVTACGASDDDTADASLSPSDERIAATALSWVQHSDDGAQLRVVAAANHCPRSTVNGVEATTEERVLADPAFPEWTLENVRVSPTVRVEYEQAIAIGDLGIDSARAVGLVGLVGIGSLIGRFAIGALADRIGRLLTLTLALASMGLSFLMWWAAGGYPALAVFALWFGLSYGGIVSLLPAICMDLFGARAVASILGTLYTGAAAGNLLGPVLAGAVFDRSGSYALVMWGSLALSGLAALASARLLGMRGNAY